jgi:hypothetical protein
MSILDQLLGGGDRESTNVNSDSSTFDSIIGTNPGLGLNASDVLQSSNFSQDDDGDVESNEFTGIGDLGLGFSAPTLIGISSSNDSMSASQSESDGGNGGLLGGLL